MNCSSGVGGVNACIEGGGAPLQAPLAVVNATGAGEGEAVYLVVLGVPSCPHCRAMERFLPSLGLDVFFCPLSRPRCAKAFAELVERGVPSYVPVIVACTGGRPVFVEVGELRDRGWWLSRLSSSRPGGRLPVYMGSRERVALNVSPDLSRLLCNASLGDAVRVGG